MSLDKDIVRNVAFLARIEVPEDRLDPLASQLSGILDWVEQLADVNTEGTEPMTSVTDAVLRWRNDIVSDGGMCDSILANAPEAIDGFFAVPKVVE